MPEHSQDYSPPATRKRRHYFKGKLPVNLTQQDRDDFFDPSSDSENEPATVYCTEDSESESDETEQPTSEIPSWISHFVLRFQNNFSLAENMAKPLLEFSKGLLAVCGKPETANQTPSSIAGCKQQLNIKVDNFKE